MKIIIAEADASVAEQLTKLLSKLTAEVETTKVLSSITDAAAFLKTNHYHNSLFFTNLKSGITALLAQKKIMVPIVFYSANAEDALQAFDNNGIGFITTPFTKTNILSSIEKYKALRSAFNSAAMQAQHVNNPVIDTNSRASSLIVNWKDKIIPVKIKDIALFNIEYKMTQVVTFANRKYFITNTLEELEEICGNDFYRANRQFIINRDAIAEATQHFGRKLVLKLKVEGEYEIIISKNRVPEFLSWLKI